MKEGSFPPDPFSNCFLKRVTDDLRGAAATASDA